MNAFLRGRIGDLQRGQPDPLVNDVHPGVTGTHRDLLGTVGVPVEPGLADQELEAPAERLAHLLDLLAQLGDLLARDGGRLADARRGTILTEHRPQRLRPLAGRCPRPRGRDRRRHDVLCFVRGDACELVERLRDGGLVALVAPALQGGALLCLDLRVDDEDSAVPPAVSGEGSVEVKRFMPTTVSSPASILRQRSRCDSTSELFM